MEIIQLHEGQNVELGNLYERLIRVINEYCADTEQPAVTIAEIVGIFEIIKTDLIGTLE